MITRPAVLTMLLLAMTGLLTGCELFAAGAEIISPSKTKAIYTLADRHTVILVDDPDNQLGDMSYADQIASSIEFELTQEKVIRSFVSMRDLQRLAASQGPAFAAMSLQDIGRTLHAEQVLHIEVQSLRLQHSDSELVRPHLTAHVKVLDVATGRRIFPEQTHAASGPSLGHRIDVHMRQSIRPAESAGDRMVLFQRLSRQTGREIARLFFDHVPRNVGDLGQELIEAR